MIVNEFFQPLFIRQYCIQTLRPLWIILPVLPLFGFFFFNTPTSVIIFAFLGIYLLPLQTLLMIVSMLLRPLPGVITGIALILITIGYFGLLAYGLDRYLKRFTVKLPFIIIASLYLIMSASILLVIVSRPVHDPTSNTMPIHILKDQQHLWNHLNCYKKGNFFDTEYFMRIEYQEGFVEYCKEHLLLEPFEIEDIPEVFWYQDIQLWSPHQSDGAQGFISKRFDFHKRGLDGKQFFIYTIPSQRLCFIWYKNNF